MSTVLARRFLVYCAAIVACAFGSLAHASAGPDVTLSDIQGVHNWGVVGNIRAYSIGSNTCNIGTTNLLWTNNGTPGLAMNAYRLHDGRLMQIGLSFVKHACCAAAQNGPCGTCNGAGGSVLGVGCLDVYSAGYNGGQGRLGPRSGINAYTGAFSPLPGGSGDAVFRRLQVRQSDLVASSFPGAIYFAEGVYVGSDDAPAGNAKNNASYKRVALNTSYDMIPQGSTAIGLPAIRAWRDHGLGVNLPDASVTVGHVDVPGEGRFWVAHKARELPGGLWRYEYAIFNLNSDKAGGGLRIPIPAGVQVSNVGFHAPFYHSGEPYNNDPWANCSSPTEICWRTAQTYAQNPNANAIRWGTMYNFWFDADTEPVGGVAQFDLFKPHTTGTLPLSVVVPSAPVVVCYANCDSSTLEPILNVDDFTCFINQFSSAQSLAHAQQVEHYANCDGSTNAPVLNVDDFTCFINAFAAGCP